jgi:hypothetical protein
VFTPFTRLGAREQALALTARPANALPGLPVVQILTTRLGRPLEDHLLWSRVPVGDDWGRLGSLLEDGSPLLAAFLSLGLGALRRDTGALLAARVLAARAFAAQAKRGVAKMALPVHTHSDGLLYAESMALGRVPLARLQLEAVQLAKFLCSFREDLRPRNLGPFHGRGDFSSGHCGLAIGWSEHT